MTPVIIDFSNRFSVTLSSSKGDLHPYKSWFDELTMTPLSMIKRSLLVGSLLLLSACNPNSPSGATGGGGRPLAKEGEFCGGIAAFQCDTGLTCKYDGDYPDAGGTCIR